MNSNLLFTLVVAALSVAAVPDGSRPAPPAISGAYLEARSCDVYTGYCVGNSEMGLSGREGMLVWSVREGSWNGTALNGLSVIAVVKTDDTLGNVRCQPRAGRAVLILDSRADGPQRAALTDLARSFAGSLVADIAEVKISIIDSQIGTCSKRGCASVKAEGLVEITTRCFGDKDHLCGNEDTFYPPLTQVNDAYPVFTEIAAYTGTGLNETWELAGRRSAFLAGFTR